MANVKISTIRRKGTDQLTIMASVTGLNKIQDGDKVVYDRLRVSLGTIHPSNWDEALKRPKTGQGDFDMAITNLHRAYNEVEVKTSTNVHARYEELMGRKTVVKNGTTKLHSIIDGWLGDDAYDHRTKSTYKVFREQHGDIDLAKCSQDDLVKLLKGVAKVHGHSESTSWKNQKILNKAINELKGRGVVMDTLTLTVYKPTKAKGGREVLTFDDIATIYNFPFEGAYKDYQTIIVTMALTGVRISDLWQLLNTIDDGNGITCGNFITTKRPSSEVSPIILGPVKDLLERNGLPKHRAEGVLRKMMKKTLAKCGIDKTLVVHDLRRSFITNFLGLGVFPDHILASVFTGHKMGGVRTVFHGYNQASIVADQRTFLKLLKLVEPSDVGGLQL